MSPSHSRHSPPALSDDDIVSIFLLTPPDDPAHLVRASIVCKAWRRILTSPDFGRLYREFHRTPPMLGVLFSCWAQDRKHDSRFIPTTAFRLKADPDFDHKHWKAVDSRHGRILLDPVDGDGNSTDGVCDFVWDPITNGRWGVPSSSTFDWGSCAAAVVCAKEHCDHLGCHGPPFLVAVVCSFAGTTFACVYSSESGLWSEIITLEHPDQIDRNGRSILVGNTLHFPYIHSYSVLQYELDEQKLSVIDVPDKNWDGERLVFISTKDGVLEFAGWRGTSLSLWSTEAGALAWTQRIVIDLEKLLPARAFESRLDDSDDEDEYELKPFVSAFAKGAVFLSTMAGLFTVELSSGRTKKVAEVEMAFSVTPWTSFYTLDHARRMRPLP